MKRTMLFTPANNPGNIINADDMGSDRIVLDIEDAVSAGEKDCARILCRYALENMHYVHETIVRVNSLATPFWQADLDEIVPAKPDFLMLPKVGTAGDIEKFDQEVARREKDSGIEIGSIKFIPIIEVAKGVENAYNIAVASPRVSALFLGAADLANDLHSIRTAEGKELFYTRNRMVIAARAAGIDVYDTPYMNVYDLEGARADAQLAKQLGFTGKAAIYPSHVEIFNDVFSPSPEEVDEAFGIIEALEDGARRGLGVLTYKGQMIDAPMAYRAQQIVDMVNEIKEMI